MKTLGILFAVGVTSCTQLSTENRDKAYVVYLPDTIASQHTLAPFTLGPQTLTTLTDASQMKGQYFQIRQGGALHIQDMHGSLIASDKYTNHKPPAVRYTLRDGIIVPSDYNTLMFFSAFYGFEKNFTNLDTNTGISKEDFHNWIGNVQIIFEPSLLFENPTLFINSIEKINAAYAPGQKQFILYQRSSLEAVPLASNLQVISHEFAHAVFEYTFFKKHYNPEGRYEQEETIRGINEGYADFASFVATGRTAITSASIPIFTGQRDIKTVNYTFQTLLQDGNTPNPTCAGEFYCYGSLFANALYQWSISQGLNPYDPNQRGHFGSIVTAALLKTQDFLTQRLEDLDFSNTPPQTTYNPKANSPMLAAFFHAFLQALSHAQSVSLCPFLQNNFGSDFLQTDTVATRCH